ncbi:THAP domain-containing protein 1-like [Rhopalosiphum maidis]|uniref:THAP domain-containing protein 1-like n=1 Tax=Rhopalosiphum maidis TaxID=43146 RepID=UPI000EFEFFD1|nr:THAP domain-containing protein 1-like [Rhopalosiphum maidis]
MSRTCIICRASTKNSTKKLSYHLFPKNEIRRRVWYASLDIKSASPSQSICGNHFAPECYKMRKGRRILKRFSVPTLK